jgi:soluble lytic murein transglycosylase-like protein
MIRTGAPLGAILFVFVAVEACSSSAQVIEIGERGEVSVYDGPAVFTADGATPLPRPAPPAASPAKTPQAVREAIDRAAAAAALSPALIEAVAWQESRLRHGAVSRAGALGEMQLMPATALALGVDPLDRRQNFGGGAAYLRALIQRYGGDLQLALAAYDAGPGAVERYRGVPPFRETRAYVAAILGRLGREAAAPAPDETGR